MAAAPSAASGVKIPPEWLHEPTFAKRSDLLEARRLERRQFALDATHEGPELSSGAGRSRFARSETIFRDSFRKSGAFDVSGQPPNSPLHFHQRTTSSDFATRSALLDQRHEQRRVESLHFEPSEILRVRDIPKAEQLREWWKQPREGYVTDPTAAVSANSLRLDLVRHGVELGPMDPGKVRCPASVDERRQLKQQKALLADHVHHIAHSIPAAYLKSDRTDIATITRAPDLYAQERPASCGANGGSGGGGSMSHGVMKRSGSLPPAFPPVSPLKAFDAQSARRRHNRPKSLNIENLILESTSQRVLLDQIKACSPLASPDVHFANSSTSSNNNTGGFGSALHSNSQPARSPNQSTGSDGRHGIVRCGGFA